MLFGLVCVLFIALFAYGDDKYTACDLNARNTSCAAGFCCVRDAFLYSETLCKALGKADDPCSTRITEFECPCEAGFRCASNINGHVTSLFGKCYPTSNTSNVDQTVG